jgi:predicted Zn-dependent protease
MAMARTDYDPAVRDQAREIAAAAAERAIENPEEPFAAWFNRAQTAALQADLDEAESSLQLAIAAHPNWYRPHWMLAQQLLRQFRRDRALKEASLAAELDAGHHPEVARTLAEAAAGSDTILR